MIASLYSTLPTDVFESTVFTYVPCRPLTEAFTSLSQTINEALHPYEDLTKRHNDQSTL